MSRTKIVCTIGPASSSKTMIEKLIRAGMDCARLNFSHGSYQDHAKLISNIRLVAKKLKRDITIIQDLQGPKIRVGVLPEKGIILKKNSCLEIIEGKEYKEGFIPINYQGIVKLLKDKDEILMDDGKIKLVVDKKNKNTLSCRVVVGGKLTSNKGVNLPTIKVRIKSITDKDTKDLRFGIKNNVDYVALSFVQSPQDVIELRKLIGGFEKEFKFASKNIPATRVIVKIEKPQAIDNLDSIIRLTDAIMVARGDLGVELSLQRVPVLQKNIIKKCLERAKPVIVATHMLESMIEKPIPTRAEVSDVANAVVDHTDAVMLSGESAMGKYPREAVKVMDSVIKDTEESMYDDLKPLSKEKVPRGFAVSFAAVGLAHKVKAKGIIVTSLSGLTVQTVARYRPEMPIIALVSHEKIKRQINLSWGVQAYLLPKYSDIEKLMDKSLEFVRKKRIFKTNDKVIFVSGHPTGKSGVTNLVKELNI